MTFAICIAIVLGVGGIEWQDWKASERDRCLGELEHDSELLAMLHVRITGRYGVDEKDAKTLICICAADPEAPAEIADASLRKHWRRWDLRQTIPFCIGSLRASLGESTMHLVYEGGAE